MTADAYFTEQSERSSADPLLVVEVGGFEGPLDLLLDLARRQKVDLHEISVLALADQYLAFIEQAGAMRIELAADYLVMAAWLAFLKSRLLLPEPPKAEGPSAAELATALAHRLTRLEAMRGAALVLSERAQLGRDVFARGETGMPERLPDEAPAGSDATLYDLLSAYARQRQRRVVQPVAVARRQVWSLLDARAALERLVGTSHEWLDLETWLRPYLRDPGMRATVLASSLSATLELVREGRASLRQDEPFSAIYLKLGEAPSSGAHA
jgi:segregation and condensation protein A